MNAGIAALIIIAVILANLISALLSKEKKGNGKKMEPEMNKWWLHNRKKRNKRKSTHLTLTISGTL